MAIPSWPPISDPISWTSFAVKAEYNILDDVLSPFGGIDIAATYDQYAGVIDFVIYAILFVGISQATIGTRFQGRGGKAVVTAVGW